MNRSKTIDFIGIGAAKSGSTWVADCLDEHPDILFSAQKSRKELNFFGGEGSTPSLYFSIYERGVDWYLDQFSPYQEGKIRGEFSNTYLIDEEAPRRIKKHFPNVKTLVVLRNPVSMVYSLYWYLKSSSHVKPPRDFNVAVRKGLFRELFLDWGLYYRHLKRYFDIFPEENIHVILLDDIRDEPEKVASSLYRFLGVRSDFLPSVLGKRSNKAVKIRFHFLRDLLRYFFRLLGRLHLRGLYLLITENILLQKLYGKINLTRSNYPPLEPEVRERLKEYFRGDTEKLEVLIGRDLSAWK